MAPNKPRRTNETSGAMDSRSLKGPFFEVPLGKPVNWLSEVVAGGLRVIGGLIGFMWDKTSGEEGLIGKSILRNANADAKSLC